jgi:hypothetical protein
MTLALRRGGPDDYDVIYDGETVGRICRMKANRQLWRWMIRLWAQPPGPSGAVSATLNEAKAAFRAMRRAAAGHPTGRMSVGPGTPIACDPRSPA